MNTRHVDYDQLAEKFDCRYPPGEISGSGQALRDLAEKVGVDFSYISKIENDNKDMKSYLIHYETGSAEQLQIKILSKLGELNIAVSELKKGKALADEVSEIIKSNN